MNQTNYGLKAKKNIGDYFTFFVVVNLIGLLQQRSYGTIFDTITTKTLQGAMLIKPPDKIIQAFEQKIMALMDTILQNQMESQTLTEIRDTLLPKLMRGNYF